MRSFQIYPGNQVILVILDFREFPQFPAYQPFLVFPPAQQLHGFLARQTRPEDQECLDLHRHRPSREAHEDQDYRLHSKSNIIN
jgi:hypothetical protein